MKTACSAPSIQHKPEVIGASVADPLIFALPLPRLPDAITLFSFFFDHRLCSLDFNAILHQGNRRRQLEHQKTTNNREKRLGLPAAMSGTNIQTGTSRSFFATNPVSSNQHKPSSLNVQSVQTQMVSAETSSVRLLAGAGQVSFLSGKDTKTPYAFRQMPLPHPPAAH